MLAIALLTPLALLRAQAIANGTYTLTPQNATGLRLDDSGAKTTTGNPIIVYTSNGTGAQNWATSDTGVTPAGYYNLATEGAYCLTASGTASGSAVVLDPCAGTTAQAWEAVKSGSSFVFHPDSNTALCLTASGTASGKAVDVDTCSGATSQEWAGPTASSSSGCTSDPSVPAGLGASGTTSSSTNLSWTASTVASGCSISSYTVYENGSTLATVTSGTSYAVTGLAASTSYSYTVAATDSNGTSAQSSAVDVTTSASSSGGAGTTTGTINFHLLLGVSGSTAGDSMTLTGGNFNDLIMSNMIAGVMYGHLVEEGYPGIQFNKDYLYGSIMGQLLQENIETELYESSSNLIDPSADQQAVMSVGQGGPYQINNYVADMVAGTYTAEGHALINYIAVQKNIGYTVANNAAQESADTPASFNNKYYGPMLPAFFHYNDMVALNVTGKGAGGWVTPWEPEYDETLANFVNLPNSFLDIILNVAYNQGYYGGLVASYSTLGATATASTVATVDAYSYVWGNNSTYSQYPYQVHYYLDQMYGNPIPTTSPTTTTVPGNHIAFSMSELETVFTDVFETLDYSNAAGTATTQYFTAAQAQSAFNSALSSNGVSSSATLDLSTASQRAQIFAVINSAISNLESATGTKFNATTTSEL
ncbi:MAG: ricin-type beta-trefoil lectin domain protein [Terracidiphilus sp.]